MLIKGDTCRDCPRVCKVIATWVPLRITTDLEDPFTVEPCKDVAWPCLSDQ